MRLLRWLFPQRFGGKAVPVKKPAAKKKPNYKKPRPEPEEDEEEA